MAQTNWIEKAFLNPQDRFTVAIHFPQGCRKIVPQGSDAGHDYISPVTFTIQIAYYDAPSTWVNLKDEDGITQVPYIIVGADVPMKDGFTKSVTYYASNNQFDKTKRFTVRIRRESASASQNYTDAHKEYVYYYTSILQSITGYRNAAPAVDPKNTAIAKTALSVVASKQLTGQIEGINAVVTTWCKIWNGSNWNTYANTSNPAALFRYVLTHPGNPQRILETDVATSIDLTKLQYWYTYCDQTRTILDNDNISRSFKFEFNSVLGSQKSVLDVLKDICAAGRASPALVDGKWSVNIDEPKNVVQHFSTHNSWGFEAVKALPKIPDCIKIQFFNELKEFQQDELPVYNSGFDETTAELFESITLPGVTNPYMVQDTGKWHFAQIKLRPEVYTINTDIEYLVCNRGDRVKVTHDVPMWGLGSGRIKNRISASVFEIDEEVYVEAGSSYTIRVRSALGASNAAQLKTSFTISSYSISNNVVTLTISNNTNKHPLVVGNTVNVSISGIAAHLGVINAVTDSTISYAKTAGNTSGSAGTVTLTNGYYSTIQLQSDLTLQNATSGDLFLYGELNQESQDLIVLSIEPTSGAKNARLTLVDYGVVEGTGGYNIFTDYPNLSSVIFDSQITNTPKYLIDSIGTAVPTIQTADIISDESVMTLISPGVFKYAISVPFINDPDLPVVIEWVQGEITRYYDNSQATATIVNVPVTSGSILFTDAVEASKYKFRLRYVTTDGRVGLWTDYADTTVVGKSNPPSNVTNFVATATDTSINLSWTQCPEIDYASTTVKYYITGAATGNTWATATTLFEGSANTWGWLRPITANYTFLIKHIDTSGNPSVTATTTTINFTLKNLASVSINANGTLTNAGGGAVTLTGIGFTGDTNATRGAPANTYVGSTLAQNVESNANTGYANANTAIAAAGQAQSTASGALSAAGQAQTTATSALNSAGTKLSKSSADILSSKITIAPNTADAGFVAGTLAWNTSGDRTSGYGVAMTPKGLVGYAANGTNTFAVNASDGSASFTGAVTATSGTFTGAVYASSGTFTGTVNASSGSFTGAVYASSGSFTGAVYASSGTFTGAVTATSGSFTGAVYASSGFFKGSLYGGAYSAYAWPSSNAGASPGFYLGPEGLLLGNNSLYSSTGGAQGGFFQVEANGNVIAPKFSISGGNAYFGGTLEAASGTFKGGVYGGDYLPQYGYNWPYANGANNLSGTGFALNSSGLLLGNYFAWAANPTGGVGYVQITNNGTFNAPGLNIANGNTVLSGSLKVGGAEIATGTNGYNTGISGAGAAIYSNGTFAMGGQTSSIVGNGAAIFLNGTVVANRNISNNAISTVTPFSSYNAARYSANNFTSNTNTSGANSSFFIVITFEVDLYYYYDASVTKVELTLSSSVDGESGGSTIKLTQGAQTPWPQTQKFQGVISFGQPTLAPSVYTITTYATVKLYNSSNAEVGSMAPPGGSASGIYCTVSGLTQHGFITEVRK